MSRFLTLAARLPIELVLLLILLLLMQTWLVAPCKVVGDSMSPGLRGERRTALCPDCQFTVTGPARITSSDATIVCPNCDYPDVSLADASVLLSDRFLTARSVFTLRPVERFETIVFRKPNDVNTLVVKRVLGLPGENIELKDGNIYRNGQLIRKSLFWQEQTAVLVHDANFIPTKTKQLLPRWLCSLSWDTNDGAYAHLLPEKRSPGLENHTDWLEYRHWRRKLPGELTDKEKKADKTKKVVLSDVVASPILDDAFPENAATELMLTFELERDLIADELEGDAGNIEPMLILELRSGQDLLSLEIAPQSGFFQAKLNGKDLSVRQKMPPPRTGSRLLFSTFDETVTFAMDGRELLRQPYPPTKEAEKKGKKGKKNAEEKSPAQVRIGARDVQVVLSQLRIYRDIFYATEGFEADWKLADDEYFVLGDNTNHSSDSRFWKPHAVCKWQVLGKPVLLYYPQKCAEGQVEMDTERVNFLY